MATEHDSKLDTTKTVKAAFCAWILTEHKKSIDPNILISTLDIASEQLQKRRIVFSPLWEITKPSVFDEIYKRARNNKLFRIMDRKTYSSFMENGRIFLKFLKSKPSLKYLAIGEDAISSNEQLIAPLTIKDAVIKVLSDEMRPLTADKIYHEIIKQGLYVFGAQNPINVVRNIIESACDNSGYSENNRVKTPCFHLERNDEGKRIYSLLGNRIAETSKSKVIDISTPSLGNIVDLNEGKKGIREILETHFQMLYGYSNINILFNAAQDTLPMFLNDNGINSVKDLTNFMEFAFPDEYVLSNPHIWKTRPNHPLSYVGVIINLARHLDGTVKREQIDEYFARIQQGSPINSTVIRKGFLMFYKNRHFILSEAVNLTKERCEVIKGLLDRLFEHENMPYIVIRDISEEWFSSLPIIKGGIKWTALLLQEVLRLCPAIGSRTIFSGIEGQALDTLGAAIVPCNSGINSFADVVHRYCYEKEILGKKMVTEDLRAVLREAGMLKGNQLLYNLHRALKDYRFAFTDENKMVRILER